MHVLLLEDNPADALRAEEYLNEDRRRRYDITHCSTLAEALQRARTHPCHAALLDLFVPDSQGMATLRTFRSEVPDAAILILTGLDDEDLAVQAVGIGAQDYVLKSSLDSEGLARSLRHAIARKDLERRLRASEESYRELFSHSLDGVASTAPDGSIFEMNQAFAEMLGYTLHELQGKTLRREDVVDLNDPRVMAAVRERGRTGRFRGEMNLVRKDGTVFPVELTSNVYVDEDGRERTSLIVRDVSEQRANEQRLRDYQEQLERSEQMSLVMIVHSDVEGRWRMVPPRFCDLLGYSERELLNMRYQDITHPDDVNDSVALDQRIVAGAEASLDIEKRYIRKDGRVVWVNLNSTIVTDRDGNHLYLRKYVRDITAERAAEEQALRNYELLLRRITSLAEEVTLAADPTGVYRALFDFTRASTPADAIEVATLDASADMLRCVYRATNGGTRHQELDASSLPLLPLEDLPPARAVRERRIVIADGAAATRVHPWFDERTGADATSLPQATAAVPMLIENDVVGVFEVRSSKVQQFTREHLTALQMAANLAAVATQNVELLARETEARKQAEAGHARLVSVLEQAPALMATTEGAEHVFAMANREYLEFFGGRDIVGRRVIDVLPELQAQGIIGILDDVYRTGESFSSKELPMDLDRCGTGHIERHYFNLVYQPLRDGDGDTIGILANAVNITEQVEARIRAESMHAEMEAAYEQTIEGWARALDLRDEETAGHSQRVTNMTVALARQFGISGDAMEDVRRGALLHDIGKMGVPDAILLKPGRLTPDEWNLMKGHTVYGRDLLRPIGFLESAIDIPYCHHEKWDGTGYPRGLRGEEIPLAARIFAVVDVYDALMSDRPYRSAWSREQVLEHLRQQAGSHFDPSVVEAFLRLLAGHDFTATLARRRPSVTHSQVDSARSLSPRGHPLGRLERN